MTNTRPAEKLKWPADYFADEPCGAGDDPAPGFGARARADYRALEKARAILAKGGAA